MDGMKIQIQSVGFTAHSRLMEFVQQKVEKLRRFEDEIEVAEVFLRLENGQEERKVAEIKLLLRGGELFASKQADSFEEAVDDALEALRRQLMKRKGKSQG